MSSKLDELISLKNKLEETRYALSKLKLFNSPLVRIVIEDSTHKIALRDEDICQELVNNLISNYLEAKIKSLEFILNAAEELLQKWGDTNDM